MMRNEKFVSHSVLDDAKDVLLVAPTHLQECVRERALVHHLDVVHQLRLDHREVGMLEGHRQGGRRLIAPPRKLDGLLDVVELHRTSLARDACQASSNAP